MSFETWLAFVAASLALLAIPGPTITLVVGYAMAQGRAAALATAFGVALGDFTAMTLSLAGLGAILAASATLFTIVKLVGAAYLVWLGFKLWSAPAADAFSAAPASPASDRRMFAHAFAVTALNPKSIVFFVAFAPQFIDRNAPYLQQIAILIATFVALALANALLYALAASTARGALRRPSVLRFINRAGGAALMGAGVAAAAWRGGQ